jgi:hypothetical protein
MPVTPGQSPNGASTPGADLVRLKGFDMFAAFRWAERLMKLIFGVAIAAGTSIASAQPVRWTKYSIPETGTSVDIPSSIFTTEAGHPASYGRRFETSDGRADLTIQTMPNADNDSPATFLAKRHPPPHLQYKRVTPWFFAVSSYKRDKVWYDRCNFAQGLVHCVLINYPASEEHDWDDVVTRISLSLSGNQTP